MSNTTSNARTFTKDMMASIVVFLVALPLCMGIAIASGAPPTAGLVTGIVGGLVVGLIAGCPLQVSGPAAGLSVIVLDLVTRHGLATLGVIVLAAGLLQLLAAALRLGQFFRAVPPSVLHGMLSGIGVLIFASQFHVMLDGAPHGSGLANLLAIPVAVQQLLTGEGPDVHRHAASIGMMTILAIVLWARFASGRLKVIPAPLVGVIVGSSTAWALGLSIRKVIVPGDIASVFSLTTLDLTLLASPVILGAALALAMIASAETLLTAVAVDAMQQRVAPTRFDRELLAQGVGNVLCGLLGGLPMTGVIVRSKANVDAGAQTRRSTVLHGAWLLLAVLLFSSALQLIPVASLAALLVYTGYKLVNPAQIRMIRQHGRLELAIFMATVGAITATDLLTGILTGLVLAGCRLLYVLTHLPIHTFLCTRTDRHIVDLEGFATFLTLPRLATILYDIPPHRTVVISTRQLDYIDYACLELLRTWQGRYAATGGQVEIDWDQLEELYRSGLAGRKELTAESVEAKGSPLDVSLAPGTIGSGNMSVP